MTTTAAPAISVLMSVYNGAAFLDAAIRSIREQSFGDFEFLVANDGSTDASAAIIDRHAAEDPRLKIYHRTNHGLVASLNFLLAEARAPLAARMDADDIARPERFARQLAYLETHPDVIVLGTNTDEIDTENRIHPCDDFHPDDPEAMSALLMRQSALCHSSVMMRTRAIRALGGYRGAFRHCEDYDLWLRADEAGDLANLPDRLLIYRRSPGQISTVHSLEQTIGAAMARLGARERRAGRADPFAGLARLPSIGELDALIGRAGVGADLRREIVPLIVHSRGSMAGRGFDLVLDHVREDMPVPGLPRAVARLARMGLPVRAARLALALANRRIP